MSPAPLDTVKTRIQNANFEQKVSGMNVIKDMLRTEGASALFKGLTPKVRLPFIRLCNFSAGASFVVVPTHLRRYDHAPIRRCST